MEIPVTAIADSIKRGDILLSEFDGIDHRKQKRTTSVVGRMKDEHIQLVRLNRELDSLYEFIYDDWRTITEEDYKMFGGQFVILIQTIKQLYDACKKQPKAMGLGEETKRLGMNYSALYELNSDIVNFCIKMPKNEEMKEVLQHFTRSR